MRQSGGLRRMRTLDLVLWIVRTRMVRIAFELELAGMHTNDRAADTSSLGIPAHAIMNLKDIRHGHSIRRGRESQKRGSYRLQVRGSSEPRA